MMQQRGAMEDDHRADLKVEGVWLVVAASR
jgi:hypothetical protein